VHMLPRMKTCVSTKTQRLSTKASLASRERKCLFWLSSLRYEIGVNQLCRFHAQQAIEYGTCLRRIIGPLGYN
jgi:hypothetical protein